MDTDSLILSEHSTAEVYGTIPDFRQHQPGADLSALAEREYNITQSAVSIFESGISHHLGGLRQTHLVPTHQEGKDEPVIALLSKV